MTHQDTIRMLRAGADWLNKHPRRWGKGSYRISNAGRGMLYVDPVPVGAHGRFCAIGACAYASRTTPQVVEKALEKSGFLSVSSLTLMNDSAADVSQVVRFLRKIADDIELARG